MDARKILPIVDADNFMTRQKRYHHLIAENGEVLYSAIYLADVLEAAWQRDLHQLYFVGRDASYVVKIERRIAADVEADKLTR